MTPSDFLDFCELYLVRMRDDKVRLNTLSLHIVLTFVEAFRTEAEEIYARMLKRHKDSGIENYLISSRYYAHAVGFMDNIKARMTGSFESARIFEAAENVLDIIQGDSRHAAIGTAIVRSNRGSRNSRGKIGSDDTPENAESIPS